MARNLPIAFAAIIAGGVLVDAAVKGASISDVVRGQAQAASGGPVGTAGGAAPTPGPGGAINPFAKATKFTAGRTDQGVDATLNAGDPILAPFAGTVTAINQNWYSGQPQIVVAGAQGTPFAGKFLYLAEQIAPSVHVGQAVNAGDQLATYASSGTGIEMGWAANAQGETLARATGGYTEGQQTPAGSSFRAFLSSLGVSL